MNRPTDQDDSIPILTQRAPARHAPPLLSEQVFPAEQATSTPPPSPLADHYRPTSSDYAPPLHPYSSHRAESPPSPAETVLRATLQAAIEEAVQEALDEAMVQVKLRLEARLPEIVARAMQSTRSG